MFLHIIVDNNSDNEYKLKLKEKFTDSIIIKRKLNGGCTQAYNDGILYALNDPNVDSILLLGNDIRLERNAIPKLHRILFSNPFYGMVGPIVLAKNSNIVEDFGSSISPSLQMVPNHINKEIESLVIETKLVDTIMGGINLASVKFYKDIGLQDENLFMYSDEIDTGIRAKKKGYKIVITNTVKSWHNHINPTQVNKRLFYTDFLKGRNKVYLAYKHFGTYKAFYVFLFHFYLFLRRIFKSIMLLKSLQRDSIFLFGSVCGLLKIKKNFKFIIN